MKWAALALAVITVALLAWGVGELHYRNCIERAAAIPIPEAEKDPGRDPGGAAGDVNHILNECSRLPWK